MRVLFITPSLLPTGPVRVFLTLAKYLRKIDVDVYFWYFDDLPGAVNEQSKKVSFYRKADFTPFNVIQSVGLRPDLFVRRNSRRQIIPTVTTMENYVEEDFHYEYGAFKGKLLSPIWRYAIQRHSKVVVLQKHMQDYYAKNWGLKETAIIGNCSESNIAMQDLDVVDRFKSFQGNSVLVGSVGSINNRKGLKQIARLIALRPELKWLHLGDGKDRDELEKLIAELGVADRVLLAGNIPNASAYISMFKIFLMPSHSEGMPLALLEAVMQKTPCITTNLPVFKAIFSDRETGQFEPNNINDFESVFEKVLENSDAFVKKSHARYKLEYSPEVVSQKYKALYTSLLNINGIG